MLLFNNDKYHASNDSELLIGAQTGREFPSPPLDEMSLILSLPELHFGAV